MMGAAFLFHGNAEARKHGLNCWKEALKLREDNAIPKTTSPQSKWEKLALKNKREFTTTEELLEALSTQKRKKWETQAFFLNQRILN
jgi:hypothetical protein